MNIYFNSQINGVGFFGSTGDFHIVCKLIILEL